MIDKEIWTKKEIRQKNQDTYELYRWRVPYVYPVQFLSKRYLGSPTSARKPRVVRKRPSEW